MMRFLMPLLCLAVLSDAAEARRYTIVRAKPRPQTIEQTPVQKVRIIPIVRWPLWCERIGGLECQSPTNLSPAKSENSP